MFPDFRTANKRLRFNGWKIICFHKYHREHWLIQRGRGAPLTRPSLGVQILSFPCRLANPLWELVPSQENSGSDTAESTLRGSHFYEPAVINEEMKENLPSISLSFSSSTGVDSFK